jgi:hypothetical protein
MKNIDEVRLETDLEYRCEYLMDFMGFGADDIEVIHSAAPLLAPLVPALVDAVYEKLRGYDATWRHFVPRQSSYEGEVPTSLEELTLDHPQIEFRKNHLGAYLKKLVTSPYDVKMLTYLDMVGKMHTPKAGKPTLIVPLIQMNALLGFVHDAINVTILSFDIPDELKGAAIRSFSKLLWIQNDLISRHYVDPDALKSPV